MSYPAHPVDVSLSEGNVISAEVEKFAKDPHRNLEYDLWYHDEPVWNVWKQDGSFIARVQIAAFHKRTSPVLTRLLTFVADIYEVDPSANITRALEEARTINPIDLTPAPDPARLGTTIKEKLEEAWTIAQTLARDPSAPNLRWVNYSAP